MPSFFVNHCPKTKEGITTADGLVLNDPSRMPPDGISKVIGREIKETCSICRRIEQDPNHEAYEIEVYIHYTLSQIKDLTSRDPVRIQNAFRNVRETAKYLARESLGLKPQHINVEKEV